MGLVQVAETAIKELLKCFMNVVPQSGSHPTITLMASPNPPHVKVKISSDSTVPGKIQLKQNYLVTTILSEVAMRYSETYCVGLIGNEMRSRLISILCPKGVFRLFEKGAV